MTKQDKLFVKDMECYLQHLQFETDHQEKTIKQLGQDVDYNLKMIKLKTANHQLTLQRLEEGKKSLSTFLKNNK